MEEIVITYGQSDDLRLLNIVINVFGRSFTRILTFLQKENDTFNKWCIQFLRLLNTNYMYCNVQDVIWKLVTWISVAAAILLSNDFLIPSDLFSFCKKKCDDNILRYINKRYKYCKQSLPSLQWRSYYRQYP